MTENHGARFSRFGGETTSNQYATISRLTLFNFSRLVMAVFFWNLPIRRRQVNGTIFALDADIVLGVNRLIQQSASEGTGNSEL